MNVDIFAGLLAEKVNMAIRQAFISGFQYAQSLNLNDNEFVDLGLPSGTKWAKKYLGVTDISLEGDYYTLAESQKMSIPTEEQWSELTSHCSLTAKGDNYIIIGPNGNMICLKRNMVYNMLESSIVSHFQYGFFGYSTLSFWIRSNGEKHAKIAGIEERNVGQNKPFIHGYVTLNTQANVYKHQVLLVKCDNTQRLEKSIIDDKEIGLSI